MIKLLANIFKSISTAVDPTAAERDVMEREFASILSIIGVVLASGTPPEDVARICESASKAMLHPDHLDQLRQEVEAAISRRDAAPSVEDEHKPGTPWREDKEFLRALAERPITMFGFGAAEIDLVHDIARDFYRCGRSTTAAASSPATSHETWVSQRLDSRGGGEREMFERDELFQAMRAAELAERGRIVTLVRGMAQAMTDCGDNISAREFTVQADWIGEEP